MTTYLSSLYMTFDRDVLNLICSYIHPSYKDYFFRDFDKLKYEDHLYFAENYNDTEILRVGWKKIPRSKKASIFNKFMKISLNQKRIDLLEFLMTKIKNLRSINYYLDIASSVHFLEGYNFIENYWKLNEKYNKRFINPRKYIRRRNIFRKK
jgi:hypothetical protein